MAYTPTEWECGDTITATKMNKIEQGIADASSGGESEPLAVGVDSVTSVLDKTWNEIYEAFPNAYFASTNAKLAITDVKFNGEEYVVTVSPDTIFASASADGYPRPDIQ